MGATAAAADQVSVRVSSGFDTLSALADEWRDLFAAAAAEPAMSFEWTEALVRTQIEPTDVSYVVQLRREGALVGVVPLFIRPTRIFRQNHLILRPVAELKNTHSDLLVDRGPEVISAFLASLPSLGSRWDSLRLSKLLEGHPVTAALRSAAWPLRFNPCLRYRKAAYWLKLPASLDEYLASRSAKFRNYSRRAEKKLRAAGQLQEIEVTTPADFGAAYEALLHVERQSWKESHGTSISTVPRQTAMYRELGRAVAAAGQLHLQLLMLNGEPIAHNFGCIHGGTYYYLKTSYAARYRPLSPATFLRLSLVEKMIARGLTAIDFCGTPYEWERQWTDTHRWHHVLSIYANTWRGKIFGAFDRWTHHSSSGAAVEHADPRSEGPTDA